MAQGTEDISLVTWLADSNPDPPFRIEVVQMHLNLSVKPFVIYGVEDIDRGRELLQQAYRSEPLFQWVLGDLKNDPQVRRGVVCVPVPCHPEAHTFSRGCGGGGQKRGAEGS